MTLRELTIDNPLLLEYRRGIRRFFGVTKHSGANAAILVVACMLYGLLMLIAISSRGVMSPMVVVIIQTFLLCFLVPASMHGAVAGERERRSWDLLLAAPITNLQIVAGKFMGGLASIGTLVLLMVPPMLVALTSDTDTSLRKLAAAELISIGYAVCLAAVTLYVSAKSKRAYAAHLMAYVVQVIALIVYFSFVMVASSESADALLFLHPFYAIAEVWGDGFSSEGPGIYRFGVVQLIAYLAIAAIVVWITVETLHSADGQEGRAR